MDSATLAAVRALEGPDPRTALLSLLLVAAHLACAVHAPSTPLTYLFLAYAVGATLAQACFLAVHEASHGLVFRRRRANQAVLLLLNLPLLVPFVAAFRDYHLEHHTHTGVDGVDTDLPSAWERRVFRGRAGKLLWLCVQLPAYALRPVLLRPKPWTAFHWVNLAVQTAFVATLVGRCGWAPVRYLAGSAWLAGGLHPTAGHFVAEHYATDGHATKSYYGAWNALALNVGAHREHHDFPRIPWTRLMRVRALAGGRWYPAEGTVASWPGTLVRFVCDDAHGLDARVRRAVSVRGTGEEREKDKPE